MEILINRGDFIKECDRLFKERPFTLAEATWDKGLLLAVSVALEQQPVEAVSLAEHNKLKTRYKKLLETVEILDSALRVYQQKYGDLDE